MNTWTVKRKLTLLIAPLLVAFVTLTSVLLVRLSSAVSDMQSLYQQDFRVAGLLSQIDGLLTRSDINILRMIAIGDPASIAQWKAQNNQRFAEVDRLLDEMRRSTDPGMSDQVASVAEAYGKMRSGMEHQVHAIEAGDLKGSAEINRLEVKDNADKTFHGLSELSQTQDQMAKAKAVGKVDGQQSAARGALIAAICATIAVTLAAIGAAMLFARSLFRQLGGEPAVAAAAMTGISKGDLSASVPLKAGDADSLMARLEDMRANLARIVSGVRAGAESVATASDQIAQGNRDLSQRTEEQASALQQTAATMDELGVTVKNNADNARQADQLVVAASSVATQGGEVVAQVVQTMKGINDSSKRIADIITVIDGIAFQTNILALNAAVEAARAGEQGRGFAVVASEVRSLAQRSAGAAKEIKSLITSSVEQVEQGTALVDTAGRTMQEIVGSVRRVSDIVGEISAASVEQSAGVGQAGQAVTQMDQATQQNAALVEESAAAAESLRRQAGTLVQAVATFKLDMASTARTPMAAAAVFPDAARSSPGSRTADGKRTESGSFAPSDKVGWVTF